MGQKQLSIYNYTDHQKFLVDWTIQQKEAGKPVSLRWLSDRLGLQSRSYLQRILKDPAKPLSVELRDKLIPILGLSASEAEYFKALVDFGHADTLEKKNQSYGRMHRLLTLRQSGVLDAARYEYLSNWWLPALREVATFRDWKEDYVAMGKQLRPEISEAQCRKGLDIMLRIGILRQEGSRFVQTDTILNSGHDLQSLAVANYHQSCLELAHSAVASQKMTEREFGAITFGVPRAAFPRLRDKIRQFQMELVEESYQVSGKPEVVYQFGVQLFQVSQEVK